MLNHPENTKPIEFFRYSNLLVRKIHGNIGSDFNFMSSTRVSNYYLWDLVSPLAITVNPTQPLHFEEYNQKNDLQWAIFNHQNKLIGACSQLIKSPESPSGEYIAFVVDTALGKKELIEELVEILRRII